MITVIKQDAHGEALIQYQGEIVEQSAERVVLQARWTLPERDLGYTRFETGDHFTEYYYTNRYFNVFAIASGDGKRKGWYCNVAEPARVFTEQIEQIDLLLDVWVDPQGELLILDEDEFASDTTLSDTQRQSAQAGLQALLDLLASHQEAFAELDL